MSVPRQECVQVPREVCTPVPEQECQQVPKQVCQTVPKQVENVQCVKVPRNVSFFFIIFLN